jgi:hypothetical protein
MDMSIHSLLFDSQGYCIAETNIHCHIFKLHMHNIMNSQILLQWDWPVIMSFITILQNLYNFLLHRDTLMGELLGLVQD